jgi:hypothetical protein
MILPVVNADTSRYQQLNIESIKRGNLETKVVGGMTQKPLSKCKK